MKAVGKYVVVLADKNKGVSQGGIILPEEEDDWANTGTIVSIGDSVEEILAEGDRVLFSKYGVTKYEIDDQEFFVAASNEVLVVLEEA